MALIDYSVRIQSKNDFHFIVPVRAGNPDHAQAYAIRFIEQEYGEITANSIVRLKGRALPVWCGAAWKAKRTPEQKANGKVDNKNGKAKASK